MLILDRVGYQAELPESRIELARHDVPPGISQTLLILVIDSVLSSANIRSTGRIPNEWADFSGLPKLAQC
jgi:hypothetical protein